jgi:hypothetical protein
MQCHVRNADNPKVEIEGLNADAGFSDVNTHDGAVVGIHSEQYSRASSFGLLSSHFDNEPILKQRRHEVGYGSAAEAGHLAEANSIERAFEKEESQQRALVDPT